MGVKNRHGVCNPKMGAERNSHPQEMNGCVRLQCGSQSWPEHSYVTNSEFKTAMDWEPATKLDLVPLEMEIHCLSAEYKLLLLKPFLTNPVRTAGENKKPSHI